MDTHFLTAHDSHSRMVMENIGYLSILIFFGIISHISADTTQPPELPEYGKSENSMEILDKLLEDYDKQVRPFEGKKPLALNVSVYINRIVSVSEANMDFTVDIYFRQFWDDPRLILPINRNSTKSIRLMGEKAELIWTPDLFFENEIQSFIHTVPVTNNFFKLSPNGRLFRSTRYTVTLACPMNLRYFPMDTQSCPIYLQSYGYDLEELHMKWIQTKVISMEQATLSQFKVKGYELMDRMLVSDTGKYSALALTIKLTRAVGYYILQIYLPATLLVVISWFSLWLSQFIAERIALGLTTLLTITTLMSSLNATAPKIPYIKAIDVYMGMCFSFVFSSLLQSVSVAHKCRSSGTVGQASKGEPGKFLSQSDRNAKLTSPHAQFIHGLGSTMIEWPNDADKMARKAFPASFIVMNAIYWGYFLHMSSFP